MSYYATTRLDPEGVPIEKHKFAFRFPVPEGKSIHLTPHVKTFYWWHPVANVYHINECNTGAYIAQGRTLDEASKNAVHNFKETGEDTFFHNLVELGPTTVKTEISFDEAMNRCRRAVEHTLTLAVKQKNT